MDSQLTLVDAHSPVPSTEENIILMFDKDDTRNTALRVQGSDLPSYVVATRHDITTVHAGDRLLATVTRRKFRPDQITFPGSRPTSLGSWLKSPILCCFPLKLRVYGKRFEWREDRLGQLVFRESGRSGDVLARFSKGRRDHLCAAYLAIKPEMVGMRDVIVLSCLLAEHKLRAIVAAQGKTVTILDTMILGF